MLRINAKSFFFLSCLLNYITIRRLFAINVFFSVSFLYILFLCYLDLSRISKYIWIMMTNFGSIYLYALHCPNMSVILWSELYNIAFIFYLKGTCIFCRIMHDQNNTTIVINIKSSHLEFCQQYTFHIIVLKFSIIIQVWTCGTPKIYL